MVSTQSDVRHKTPLEDSHPHPTAMVDTLQQLQNRITKMEQHHKEKLTKLKADHDQLEAYVRRLQGDEQATRQMT